MNVVERVGVEPTKPVGRLGYNQGISPLKASPKCGVDNAHHPVTCCHLRRGFAGARVIGNPLGAGACAHSRV